MFVKKEDKQRYCELAKQYVKKEALKISYSLTNSKSELSFYALDSILGDYPKASWIDAKNVRKQVVNFMDTIGSSYNKICNKVYLDDYKYRVQNYMNFSGRGITENLIKICAKTGGRVSFECLLDIIGNNYPKYLVLGRLDERQHLIIFMWQLFGLNFRYDSEYVYIA